MSQELIDQNISYIREIACWTPGLKYFWDNIHDQQLNKNKKSPKHF